MASTAIAATAVLWAAVARTAGEPRTAGFWFEPVRYESARLGGALTHAELSTIDAVARREIARAFAGLRIELTDRRDASVNVRVLQEVRDPRFRRDVQVAGASRAIAGFGGGGAVNFTLLANAAIGYAHASDARPAMVQAIGRGVGRAAVHEFAHQLFPSAPLHDTADPRSYEFGNAARREQYYGDMHWAHAWPLLQKRVGMAVASGQDGRR